MSKIDVSRAKERHFPLYAVTSDSILLSKPVLLHSPSISKVICSLLNAFIESNLQREFVEGEGSSRTSQCKKSLELVAIVNLSQPVPGMLWCI